MDAAKPIHRLSNVDLERRTATCSVCGDTKIYVGYDPRVNKYAPTCSNRVVAYNKIYQERRREKRWQNPNWKPRHTVSQVDLETMTGICSVCGPTKVYKCRGKKGNSTTYLCAVKVRKNQKEWRNTQLRKNEFRRTYKSSTAMLFLEQEQKQTIEMYKVENGCRACGYQDDPDQLQLHFRDLDESEFHESKLVHFTRKRLVHALKIAEVYCARCHPWIHNESESLQAATPYQTVN